MTDIRKLLNQIAAQEAQLRDTQFLAPCVGGGRIQSSVQGMLYTFTAQPQDFEGWGIFQAVNEKTAEMVEEPSLPQVAEYLQLLKPLRLRLAHILRGQTWLAYPVNESDMQQRLGIAKPIPVHLVTEGGAMNQIIARWDGSSWWFDELDRRADPFVAEQLREHLRQVTPPEAVLFSGMTPEMRTVYDLAVQQTEEFQARRQQRQEDVCQGNYGRDRRLQGQSRSYQKPRRKAQGAEGRLQKALWMGGGELQEFRDRSEFWQIEWITSTGERHTSAISKNDLTVISSGICLSGMDRNFDLQSLVGVIEGRYNEDCD